MKRISLYFITIVIGIICVSCEGKLEQINPNAATENTFWQDEEDFELALTSCYTPLKNALNGGYYGTRGVMMRIARADEVEFRNDISEVFQACFFTNSNSNSLSQGMFYQIYNALYRTNTIMQELEKKLDVFSSEFIDKVTAECMFIRGFYLFQLGKEFKNAPLRLTASQSPSTFPLEKSSQAEIWDQAVADLLVAEPLLPVVNDVIGKPTKGAANALLGKIYLYQDEYEKAISVLEPLTKSPYTYQLDPEFSNNFNEEGEFGVESIFELMIEDVGGTDIWGDGENINSTQSNTRPKEYAAAEVTGWYEATVTQQMMDIFLEEPDRDGNTDYRARSSVAWDYDGCMYYMKPFREILLESNWSVYWIIKYQNSYHAETESPQSKSFINERVIRYAEVLLMLSECYLRGRNDISTAVSYINQIRERANLNPYSGEMTYDGVFADLEHQRAIEFFVEGERFYDLRRWGLLEQRLQTCSTVRYNQFMTGVVGDTNRYYYYPIPAKEIETNPLCTPNEGW